MENENKQNIIQDTDIKHIVDDIKEIKDSIKILNDHSIKIEKVATDVEWLKRTYWIFMTAAIGGLITGLLNLLIK